MICFCITKPNSIAAFHGNLPNALLRAELATPNHPFTVRGTVQAQTFNAVGQLLGIITVAVHPPNLKTPRVE
jgi:hypothetical protein